jgi:hypothetical protein
MVTQPGYIERLKEYSRRRVKDAKAEGAELIADYSAESDRGAIILAATSLEDIIETMIKQKLPGLKDDESTARKLFERDGAIASFSRKIEMAYALGIIDKEYKKRIDIIREIRNACAHSRFPLSLEKEVLRNAIKALLKATWNDLKDHASLTVRLAFVVECAFIGHYVTTGEKIEGVEAHLKHYAALKASGAIS